MFSLNWQQIIEMESSSSNTLRNSVCKWMSISWVCVERGRKGKEKIIKKNPNKQNMQYNINEMY